MTESADEVPAAAVPADDTAAAAAAMAPAPRRGFARRALRGIGWLVLVIVCFALAGWSVLAVCYTDLAGGRSPRYVAAALTALVLIACPFFFRPRKFRLVAFAAVFGLIVLWFFSRQPSNDREWAPDVQRLAKIDF